MLVLRLASSLKKEQLLEIADEYEFAFLNPNIIKSKEELLLAHYLVKKSFKEKTNIAKKQKLEFLLWVTGTHDIDKAFECACFNNPKDFLVVCFFIRDKNSVVRLLKASEKKLKLDRDAEPLSLERISLSRIH